MQSVINSLKEEDQRISNAFRYIVGIPHNAEGTIVGPASYNSKRNPQVLEKSQVAQMLTGKAANITIPITDEDVSAIDEKAWQGKLKAFNDYVGKTYKPADSPANKELLNKIYPEYMQMQKEEIDNYHDFKKKIEGIKCRDAQNKEEMFLAWRLGYPVADPAGTDADLVEYVKSENAPGVGKITEMPVYAQGTAKFQAGIWSAREKNLQMKALINSGAMSFKSGHELTNVYDPRASIPVSQLMQWGEQTTYPTLA